MSKAETHEFGIKVVFDYLKREGHIIVAVNTDNSVSPQIVAQKDGQLEYVVVHTACYPKKGTLEPVVRDQCIEHAEIWSTLLFRNHDCRSTNTFPPITQKNTAEARLWPFCCRPCPDGIDVLMGLGAQALSRLRRARSDRAGETLDVFERSDIHLASCPLSLGCLLLEICWRSVGDSTLVCG